MDTPDELTTKLVPSDRLSLLELLSNPVFLYQTAPYLPPSSLLALGATSKSFRNLIYYTRGVFRHIDLTNVKSVQFDIAPIDHGGEIWRNVQMDENVTEDDFYSGPLRGVFGNLRRRQILQDVQTLILDGLSVTSELISEIILNDSFNVRLLSIREVKNLNERKLMQALQYAVRPSRPENTPRLKALYVFGPKDAVPAATLKPSPASSSINSMTRGGVISSLGAQIGAQLNQKAADQLTRDLARDGDNWYYQLGQTFNFNQNVSSKISSIAWAETLFACQGIISFDTIMCTGPRHTLSLPPDGGEESAPWYTHIKSYISPTLASIALDGCTICRSAPEGMTIHGKTPSNALPLLAPPPLHSSSIKAATYPTPMSDEVPRMLARCTTCLKNRYCESCHKWWCESCYEVICPIPNASPVRIPHSLNLENFSSSGSDLSSPKVYMRLCTEDCLVSEMMSGAGSNGMWG